MVPRLAESRRDSSLRPEPNAPRTAPKITADATELLLYTNSAVGGLRNARSLYTTGRMVPTIDEPQGDQKDDAPAIAASSTATGPVAGAPTEDVAKQKIAPNTTASDAIAARRPRIAAGQPSLHAAPAP